MQNYNFIQRQLHKIILNSNLIKKSIFEIEKNLFFKNDSNLKNLNHIFISSLPRSGTTMILDYIYQTNEFASITYEDGIGVGTVTTSGGVGEVVIVWTDSDGIVVNNVESIQEFDTYTVNVIDENGCTASSEVSQTVLNELDPLAFGMFPNPTSGEVTLQISSELEELNMQVFDATGRMVLSQDYVILQSSISLDFSYLSAGTYTVMLSNNHGVSLLRLSIQH